ncbi:MAG: acylphosphatase [Rhodospirillaceae bacterium]|nr:acylphosphatase [Rhodospirillaceae bacterium]
MTLVIAVSVIIKGRVQGVGFRFWLAREAEALGLGGWVRNCRDGTVEALFSGAEDEVRKMITRCHRGPPISHVTRVIEEEAVPPNGRGFDIQPTAP